MDTTVAGIQKHFDDLYSLRNLFVNGSFHERCTHMTAKVGKLVDAERKQEPIQRALVQATGYFFSLVNYYRGYLDLSRGMMVKFPIHGCAYCGLKPCECQDGHRPEPILGSVNEMQAAWSLHEWQMHLQAVYGRKNSQRTGADLVGRMSSELGELATLNAHGHNTPLYPNKILEECEKEAADAFSWLIAISYTKSINLQVLLEHCYSVCPGPCGQKVCQCPLVIIDSAGDYFTTTGTRRDTIRT